MPLRGASGSSVHLAGMHLGTLLHVPLLHTWVGIVVMRAEMVVTMMNIGMLSQVLLLQTLGWSHWSYWSVSVSHILFHFSVHHSPSTLSAWAGKMVPFQNNIKVLILLKLVLKEKKMMHFCSMVAKSWQCKSDNNKSIGQRLAKILVYCEKPWWTRIGLQQLAKLSHRGLVGGRLELGEALYVDRLVVPCQGQTVSLPSFFIIIKRLW